MEKETQCSATRKRFATGLVLAALVMATIAAVAAVDTAAKDGDGTNVAQFQPQPGGPGGPPGGGFPGGMPGPGMMPPMMGMGGAAIAVSDGKVFVVQGPALLKFDADSLELERAVPLMPGPGGPGGPGGPPGMPGGPGGPQPPGGEQ